MKRRIPSTQSLLSTYLPTLATVLSTMIITTACSTTTSSVAQVNHNQGNNNFLQSYANASNIKTEHIPLLYQAEQTSSPAARAVLRKARIMSLDKREIVKGACWDYLNAVFKRAGVKRDTIFKERKNGGKYFNSNDIQAGDWLYYINHSYHGIEHSGMFIGWVDKSKKQALILSYAGGNRHEPARYKIYDISHVYNVMRPVYGIPAKKPIKAKVNKPITKATTSPAKLADKKNINISVSNTNTNTNVDNSDNLPLEKFRQNYANAKNIKANYLPLVYTAEQESSKAAHKVLRLSRVMALDRQEVLQGTSRNYVYAVFLRSGVKPETIFKSNYPKGPFFYVNDIQVGDWLSFINHSYHDVEHNGVFVGWTDKSNNKALIMSYPGENRYKPARYSVYDISDIYQVVRPVLK